MASTRWCRLMALGVLAAVMCIATVQASAAIVAVTPLEATAELQSTSPVADGYVLAEMTSESAVAAAGSPFAGLASKVKAGVQAKVQQHAPKVVSAIKSLFAKAAGKSKQLKQLASAVKSKASSVLGRATAAAKAAAKSSLQAASGKVAAAAAAAVAAKTPVAPVVPTAPAAPATPAAAAAAVATPAAPVAAPAKKESKKKSKKAKRKSRKSRRSRKFNDAQKRPNFGARAADPIPEPFPRKTPAPLKPGEVSTTQCTDEGRRRIAMCIKIIGTVSTPNAKNEILFTEKAVTEACKSAYSVAGEQITCQAMHAHIFTVADIRQLNQAIRNEDPHNSCVKLLGTSVGTQAWLSRSDAEQCHMSHIAERQNEGVTGSRCLFFHGSGVSGLKYDELHTVKGDYDGFVLSYPLYWSGVAEKVGGSCDKRFYVTDTITRGWDESTLQQEYCAAIRQFQPHAIFAHSTANNVIAAAIANGVAGCEHIAAQDAKVQSGDSVWFSMNAPLQGTPLVDSLKIACAKSSNVNKQWYAGVCSRADAAPYFGFSAISTTYTNLQSVSLRNIPETFGQAQLNCNQERLKNHFEPEESIRAKCKSLSSIAAKFSSGSLCGVAPDHFSKTPKRALVQSKQNFLGGDPDVSIEWGRDASTEITNLRIRGHDGLVPFGSCQVPNRTYTGSPSSAFYVTKTNHDDGRCAHGEGKAADQQPCSWIANRVAESTARFASLQNFKAGSVVNAPPSAVETAPSFGGFKYDLIALTQRIRDELDVHDAKVEKSQPVLDVATRLSKEFRRTGKKVEKPIWATKAQIAEIKKQQKIVADANRQEILNAEAYEQAIAA